MISKSDKANVIKLKSAVLNNNNNKNGMSEVEANNSIYLDLI
jgi:hypothetical protein